jgi:hypothetical protein
MGRREARRAITELKRKVQALYPDTEIKEGPGFEGGPQDIYLYAFTTDDAMDKIIEMASPRILDILLKTDVLVHLIPLRPGTMQWLWGNGNKRQSRRSSHALAESRASYKVGKSAARRKATRKT